MKCKHNPQDLGRNSAYITEFLQIMRIIYSWA